MKKVLSVMIITLCLFFVGMTSVSAKEYLKRNDDMFNYEIESATKYFNNNIDELTAVGLTTDDMVNFYNQLAPSTIEKTGTNYNLKKVCEAFGNEEYGGVCGRDNGASIDGYVILLGITEEEKDMLLEGFTLSTKEGTLTQEEDDRLDELESILNSKKDSFIERITNAQKNTIKKEGTIAYPSLGEYKYALYSTYDEDDNINDYWDTIIQSGIIYSLVEEADPVVVTNPKTLDMNIPLMIFGTVALIGISAVSYRKLKKTN